MSDSPWMSYEDSVKLVEAMKESEAKLLRIYWETGKIPSSQKFKLSRPVLMEYTRQQQEKELEEKYLNQIISFHRSTGGFTAGKVNRISYWTEEGQETVIFEVGTKQYKVDLEYFKEQAQIL